MHIQNVLQVKLSIQYGKKTREIQKIFTILICCLYSNILYSDVNIILYIYYKYRVDYAEVIKT